MDSPRHREKPVAKYITEAEGTWEVGERGRWCGDFMLGGSKWIRLFCLQNAVITDRRSKR